MKLLTAQSRSKANSVLPCTLSPSHWVETHKLKQQKQTGFFSETQKNHFKTWFWHERNSTLTIETLLFQETFHSSIHAIVANKSEARP